MHGEHRIETKKNLFTNEQLQREYQYFLAQSIVQKLLEKGMISSDEFDKITELNRKSFSPFLAAIMPKNR